MWRTHISHSVADPHRRGNNIIPCVVDPQVMEKWTSTLKVVGILVALKSTVNRNVNSHCWKNFGSSESYVDNSDSWREAWCSRFLVALIATGMSTLKVVGILVALEAAVDINVNSHCWQDIGSFEKLHCQLWKLTGSIVSSRFLVALIATGMSTLKVVGILVALEAAVDINVNSHCWQDIGSFEKLHCQLW